LDDETKNLGMAPYGADREPAPMDAVGMAVHFQNVWRDINRGHRKNLHAFLAGATNTKRAFLDDPDSYGVFRFNEFWTQQNKLPETIADAHPLMTFLMKATSDDAKKRAGRYARVVDYLIAKDITDCEAYLNQHGYEKILAKSVVEYPSNRNTRKNGTSKRVTLRMSNSDWERVQRVQQHSDVAVKFVLTCEMPPGGTGGISARLTFGIEPMTEEPISKEQFRANLREHMRSWEIETKLAGGITPYIESSRHGSRFILGMRGGPLAEVPTNPLRARLSSPAKAIPRARRKRTTTI
jgi:hypothetical protein